MEHDRQRIWIAAATTIFISLIVIVIIIGLCKPAEPNPIEGQVELTDHRISSKLPSRVEKFYVKEGDNVHKGDTLVVLSSPEIMAKLEQAEGAHTAAEAISEKADNGAREEQIRGAYEIWQQAHAAAVIAKQSYTRISHLYTEGVMSAQKRDEVKANLDASIAQEAAAKSQYDMAVNGARKEDKKAAKAVAYQARGAVNEVESYVRETVFTSPCNGYVTEIFPEVGELVGTGAPIMNINDADDVWFTFNVREDRLQDVAIGRIMNVYVTAVNRTIPARVTLMKDVGSFAVWKATKSLGEYDLKTFEVKVRPLTKPHGLEVGMSAILKK